MVELPAVLVSPTPHGLQVVVVLPVGAVPPTSEVALPVGQFVQLKAPAEAPLAGASMYIPLLQSLQAAATKALTLNFPATQLVQVFAPNATPPMEDLPAAHVTH